MGITRHLTTAASVARLRSTDILHTSQTFHISYMKVCACRLQDYQTVSKTRSFSTETSNTKSNSSKSSGTEIDIARKNPYADLSFGEKVKEVGKDASYTSFIIIGVGILGSIVYVILRELFSSESPNGIYKRALKRCINDIELSAALGEPIKGYGETSRRGRRRHVSHTEYLVDNQKRLRLQFYVEGTEKKGTVQVEMVKNEFGKYDFRFLLVQLDQHPYRTFILEDNR